MWGEGGREIIKAHPTGWKVIRCPTRSHTPIPFSLKYRLFIYTVLETNIPAL